MGFADMQSPEGGGGWWGGEGGRGQTHGRGSVNITQQQQQQFDLWECRAVELRHSTWQDSRHVYAPTYQFGHVLLCPRIIVPTCHCSYIPFNRAIKIRCENVSLRPRVHRPQIPLCPKLQTHRCAHGPMCPRIKPNLN